MTKIYYNYSSKGYYVGSRQARKNPLEKDIYLLPAFATFEKPPEIIKRKNIRWDGKKWIYEDIPKKPELNQAKLLKEEKEAKQSKIDEQRNNDYSANLSITNSSNKVVTIKMNTYLAGVFPGLCEAYINFIRDKKADTIQWPGVDGSILELTIEDFNLLKNKLLIRLSNDLVKTNLLTISLQDLETLEEVEKFIVT